jgi:hypothetical protein
LPAEPVGPWWERSQGVNFDVLAADHRTSSRVLPAGQQMHYSNLGYAILGRAVEMRIGSITNPSRPWRSCNSPTKVCCSSRIHPNDLTVIYADKY